MVVVVGSCWSAVVAAGGHCCWLVVGGWWLVVVVGDWWLWLVVVVGGWSLVVGRWGLVVVVGGCQVVAPVVIVFVGDPSLLVFCVQSCRPCCCVPPFRPVRLSSSAQEVSRCAFWLVSRCSPPVVLFFPFLIECLLV